jgi:hypothetical protein
MKKILLAIFVALIMISVATGYYFKQDKALNGNNEDSIKKYLYSNLIPKTENDINIIDTVEIENSKIVGFSTNKGQGVVMFDKDKKGNYTTGRDGVYDIIDKKHIKVSAYSVRYGNDSKSAYVIISDGKDVSKVEIVVNDKKNYSKKVKLNEPSMVIFNENELRNVSTSRDIKFNFFNSEGTLIEER